MIGNYRLHLLAVLILAFIISWIRIDPFTYVKPFGDSTGYLSVAYKLYETGVFSDGNYADQAVHTTATGQGMFFSPGYPALIAAYMAFDKEFVESIGCMLKNGMEGGGCSYNYGYFLVIQILLVSLSLAMIWLCAYLIFESLPIAWLAYVIALIPGIYSYYAVTFYTENLFVPVFTAMALSLILQFKKRHLVYFLLTAALIGASALVRPSMVYVFYSYVIAMIGYLAIWQKDRDAKWKAKALALIICGYAVVAGPWVMRNGHYFDEYSISSGYGPFILVQRVAYNMMSWQEVGTAFVYWFPDAGDGWAKKLFTPDLYEKLDFANPEGYYQLGNRAFKEQMLEQAGGCEHFMSFLLKEKVLGDFTKHIGVTFALLYRGIWIEKYWGLISMPLLLAAMWINHKRHNELLLAFALPAFFLAGLHAFATVSIPRYNIILVPALSIGAAFSLYMLGTQCWHYLSRKSQNS